MSRNLINDSNLHYEILFTNENMEKNIHRMKPTEKPFRITSIASISLYHNIPVHNTNNPFKYQQKSFVYIKTVCKSNLQKIIHTFTNNATSEHFWTVCMIPENILFEFVAHSDWASIYIKCWMNFRSILMYMRLFQTYTFECFATVKVKHFYDLLYPMLFIYAKR